MKNYLTIYLIFLFLFSCSNQEEKKTPIHVPSSTEAISKDGIKIDTVKTIGVGIFKGKNREIHNLKELNSVPVIKMKFKSKYLKDTNEFYYYVDNEKESENYDTLIVYEYISKNIYGYNFKFKQLSNIIPSDLSDGEAFFEIYKNGKLLFNSYIFDEPVKNPTWYNQKNYYHSFRRVQIPNNDINNNGIADFVLIGDITGNSNSPDLFIFELGDTLKLIDIVRAPASICPDYCYEFFKDLNNDGIYEISIWEQIWHEWDNHPDLNENYSNLILSYINGRYQVNKELMKKQPLDYENSKKYFKKIKKLIKKNDGSKNDYLYDYIKALMIQFEYEGIHDSGLKFLSKIFKNDEEYNTIRTEFNEKIKASYYYLPLPDLRKQYEHNFN
jgi:hypothetical protein